MQDTVDAWNNATSAFYAFPPTTPLEGAVYGATVGLENSAALLYRDLSEIILAARWDFHKSASFKVEYIFQEEEGFDYDLITRETTAYKRNPAALRFGIDLVF